MWVTATQEELGPFTRVTAIVSQQSIGPFPQAPLSHRTVGLTLEVVAPNTDRDGGADVLEDIIPAILDYLDTRYQHGTATAFLYGERFAYTIPVSVIASKEN